MEVVLLFRTGDGTYISTKIHPHIANGKLHRCMVTRTEMQRDGKKMMATFSLKDEAEVAQFLVFLFADPSVSYDFPAVEQLWKDNRLDDIYEDKEDGTLY